MLKSKFTILFIFILLPILFSCNSSESESSDRMRRPIKGDAIYGGLLRMNISDEIRSIFPHNMVDASAHSLMNQVYEGLVQIDKETQAISPALAERFEVSADGKLYTFHLREDVFFHDDKIFENGKGRQMKAMDVVKCFEKLCEPSPYNQMYAFVIDIIKGGRVHYESVQTNPEGNNGLFGVREISDFVVEIELEYPAPTFITILTHPCCWIFPAEIYKYGEEINNWCIGTGPFKARTVKMNEVMIFERNPAYWQEDDLGNSLPYLDAVRCNFIPSDRQQLSEFLGGNLDLILRVPFENIAGLEERIKSDPENSPFRIITQQGLRVEYYGFQHRSDLFGDEKVRKAINFAIDREFLVNEVLLGYGVPATKGFVPPSMPGFDKIEKEGFTFKPELARKLLSEAGYEGGDGFPVITIQLNDGNQTAIEVAAAVQEMLTENLGLTVELSVLPRDKHYDQIEMGHVNFWRDGWIADYPDPENFLKLFHGKLVPQDSQKASYLNTVRFKNAKFDEYFESSLRETDAKVRMELFHKADQEIINHAAVAPLYYEKWIWLVGSDVQNLESNNMGELDLSRVYFKKL